MSYSNQFKEAAQVELSKRLGYKIKSDLNDEFITIYL